MMREADTRRQDGKMILTRTTNNQPWKRRNSTATNGIGETEERMTGIERGWKKGQIDNNKISMDEKECQRDRNSNISSSNQSFSSLIAWDFERAYGWLFAVSIVSIVASMIILTGLQKGPMWQSSCQWWWLWSASHLKDNWDQQKPQKQQHSNQNIHCDGKERQTDAVFQKNCAALALLSTIVVFIRSPSWSFGIEKENKSYTSVHQYYNLYESCT